MATPIKPITRAVLMLDQSTGELREEDGELLGLDLWPETRNALSTTEATDLEIILAVPTDLDPAAVSDLSGWMEGMTVASISPDYAFSSAGAAIKGLSGSEPSTAFISADRRLRGEAAKAGLYPAPHVAILPMLKRGEAPQAMRMVGPKEVLTRLGLSNDVIPMHFQPTDGKQWAMIALVAGDIETVAVVKRVQLNPLSYDPMTDDLVWARIDEDTAEVREALASRKILYAESGQVLIALGPDESAEALRMHGRHGHSELLVPSPNLLRPAIRESMDSDAIDPRSLPNDIFEKVEPTVIDPRILRPACKVVTADYEENLNRYTGVTALDTAGPIISRHTAHPHNKRAEAQLLKDLNALGYCAYRHNFTHAGQTHSNIIADLPGTGYFRIRPDILERYRRILRTNPSADSLRSYQREMQELTESHWFQQEGLSRMSDAELREQLEKLLRLRPWYPWWKKLCKIAGYGADLVIVGGHLDSTAGFEPGYVAASDPAPGRDDNASGLAGLLSLARYMRSLCGKLTHTVRFCFFNAEESGLVGSKAYAAKLKSLDAPIRAIICMDMIGHNSDDNRLFEIHAGYTDRAIRDLSLPLAADVENAAAALGQLAPAQVYAGTSWSGAPDRSVYDGAINRSDHAAFHQQSYGAVLVSEDFFANLASEPGADPNPNYHRATDTFVDVSYARDIVCAVAQAVVKLAR